jgi:hypothetical protein
MKLIYAMIALIALGHSAQAFSGNDLVALCTSKDKMQQTICFTYVRGVADALRFDQGVDEDLAATGKKSESTYPVCVPIGATARQLAEVAVAYFKRTPEYRHEGAAGGLALAWLEVYPCEGKPKKRV